MSLSSDRLSDSYRAFCVWDDVKQLVVRVQVVLMVLKLTCYVVPQKLRVLIVGAGGREHALAWKLAQSVKVVKVFVAPGKLKSATSRPKLVRCTGPRPGPGSSGTPAWARGRAGGR